MHGYTTYPAIHKKNTADFCTILGRHPGKGSEGTHRSHLSLLFRQGSQFMAFRARFVGGLPPSSLSARGRTVPAVEFDFMTLGRGTPDPPASGSAMTSYSTRRSQGPVLHDKEGRGRVGDGGERRRGVEVR